MAFVGTGTAAVAPPVMVAVVGEVLLRFPPGGL
jgi:hypothetical protein